MEEELRHVGAEGQRLRFLLEGFQLVPPAPRSDLQLRELCQNTLPFMRVMRASHVVPDPGDKTYGRYRYQSTYAAILSLELLADPPEVEEVVCEYYEDILLKMKDGRFRAIQVKTRERQLPHWKAADKLILSALARFVDHDLEGGERFSRFIFATNHAFYAERKNGQNLPYLLDLARQAVTAGDLRNRSLKDFLRRLEGVWLARGGGRATQGPKGAGAGGPSREERDRRLLAVLARVEIEDDLPELDGIQSRLRDHISFRDPRFAKSSLPDLFAVSLELTKVMFLASSNFTEHLLRVVLHGINPRTSRRERELEAKRITAERLQQTLSTEWARLQAASQPAPGTGTSGIASTAEDETLVLEIMNGAARLTRKGALQAEGSLLPELETFADTIHSQDQPEVIGEGLRERGIPVAIQQALSDEHETGSFRLHLRTRPLARYQLPWGYLFEPQRGFLATRAGTPFAFLSPEEFPALRGSSRKSRFTIACALACPRSLDPGMQRKLTEMYADAHQALTTLSERGPCALVPIDPCTLLRLFEALSSPPDVLHLVATMSAGRILLEDESAAVRAVDPLELAERIGATRLVVFDLAHTAGEPTVIPELFHLVHRLNGRAVIQWHEAVGSTMSGWRNIFYETVAAKGEVDTALNSTRSWLRAQAQPWLRLTGALRRSEDLRLEIPAGTSGEETARFDLAGFGRPTRTTVPREALMTLTDVLFARTAHRGALLVGRSNTGKTEVACLALWQLRAALEGIWTCRCDELATFEDLMMALLLYTERSSLVASPPPPETFRSAPRRFAEWLGGALLRPRRVVIFFDRLESWLKPGSRRFQSAEIESFLAALAEQASGYGRLLLTTRRPFDLPAWGRREHLLSLAAARWQVKP